MKIKTASLVTLFAATSAHAYNDHSSWSQDRGSYSGSYQYMTETEAWQTKATLRSVDSENNNVITTTPYKGVGFRVSLGTELAKFVRFTTYSSYRDLTNSLTDSLRAYQVGGECSLSFYGPVVNLQIGVGVFGSRQLQQKHDEGKTYVGIGSTGLIGVEKFISPKASVIFSVKGQEESLKPDQKQSKDSLETSSTGVSVALALWI